MDTLMERAHALQRENIFLGGPLNVFEVAGRKQLIVLLSEGMYPGSRILDIGCGCLRSGYWLIHFLDPGCYCGIEPNRKMLEAGIRILLEPGLIEIKKPSFASNADFDFSIFGTTFDFFLARSIWTHASKAQITRMLDGFAAHSTGEGTFLVSYKRPSLLNPDYKGEEWIGKSHESDCAGMVRHSLGWIRRACGDRDLTAREITDQAYNFGGQTWLEIRRAGRTAR